MKSYIERLEREIRLKQYSYRTEQAYVGWIKRYLRYLHNHNIKGNYENKITSFLNDLVENRNVAASTQNQALCSLIFFYRHVLDKNVDTLENLEYASKKSNLPVVLSEDEVNLILKNMAGVKKLIVSILYGSGLRISECLRLRIMDVDFEYHQIEIRNSKGNRDRISVLPDLLIGSLKRQIKRLPFCIKKILIEDMGTYFYRMHFSGNMLMPLPS